MKQILSSILINARNLATVVVLYLPVKIAFLFSKEIFTASDLKHEIIAFFSINIYAVPNRCLCVYSLEPFVTETFMQFKQNRNEICFTRVCIHTKMQNLIFYMVPTFISYIYVFPASKKNIKKKSNFSR